MEIYGNLSVANPVCRTSQKCVEYILKTSSRRLEDIFARRFEDVLNIPWRCFTRRLKDVFKTF